MKWVVGAGLLLISAVVLVHSQIGITTQELTDALPDGKRIEQFVLTNDGRRTYYTTASGEVWLFDRAGKNTTRIVDGGVWDLSVSPAGDALAYTRAGETRIDQYVWTLRLDPKTGVASGTERRVSSHTSDVPSISPDGKSIAFARDDANGVGQSVVVVPIGGGDERVVASALPSSIGNIRWTPDGKTLYFGVNPPVPFTCAESCLSVPGGNPQIPGTIRRVAVAGGSPTIVATTGSPLPGLTPDGTMLAFGDPGGNRQFVVADSSGKRLTTFTLPQTQTLQSWSGSSTLLAMAVGTVRRVRSVALADASSRVLFENPTFMLEPNWSPDGKMVSVMRRVTDHCELRIMNADGSLRKTIDLPEPGCGASLQWTPNQQRLIYNPYLQPDRRLVISTVDIASGQRKPLYESSGDVNWIIESNTLIVSDVSSTSPRRLSFRQIDFDGKSTLLRELPFDEPEGSYAAPLNRSTAMVMRTPRELRVIRTDGTGDDRVVSPAQNGYVLPQPSISADKQWAAFRINPSGTDATRMNVIELLKLDGTQRRTIDLPFFAQGANTLVIFPGGKELVVSERPSSPSAEPGLYLVNVETRAVKKLLNYTPQGRWPELAASPDGRTLLALITETPDPTVSAIDLSHLR